MVEVSDIDIIKTARLMEYNDFVESGMNWDDSYITLADIADGIQQNIQEQYEQYLSPVQTGDCKCRGWHIGRVIFFINRPERITPIDIDNLCLNNDILSIPIIEDGHHRLMAHLYLGNTEIEIRYGGRLDLLKYLTGDSDIKPS